MTIKCPKCHFENPDDTVYCGKCATPLPSSKEIPVTETLETPIEELTTGSTFAGRYQIIEELGKGGMGKVYRVVDKKLNEEVVLKLIKPEIASDKKTLERFSNELKIARKIVHKNVGRMYGLGEEGETLYITMKYVSGEDLESYIRRAGPLSAAQTIFIAKQVCEGLAEAHRRGIVHRDLKPQNIMIDKEGNARIMDFGIARSFKTKGTIGTEVMIGTPEYMSPEQVEGKDVDQRSDIYSLGMILYEMVTGRVPFEGETPLGIAMKHKSEIPKDPRELNSQIPEDLSKVILRCMEKDKERRFQTAEELISELSKVEKGIPIPERFIPMRTPETVKKRAPSRSIYPMIREMNIFLKKYIHKLWKKKEEGKIPQYTINRFPDVSLRDKVALNRRCTLRVAVTQRPIREELKEHKIAIRIPFEEESTTVDVLVTAEDFEIIGDDYLPLVVPAKGDSEPILFQMIPRSTGIKKVKVEFLQNSRYIGGVTATTTVVVPAEMADGRRVSTRGIIGFDRGALAPDLTIFITEIKSDGDQMKYMFILNSPANGLYFRRVREELSFPGSPSKWMNRLYQELGTLGEEVSSEDIDETLSSIGTDLYEQLFPRELKEIWERKIRGKVKSVMIISDEPWIPWEIIKPSYEIEPGKIIEDDFLCGSYLVTRWIAGPPPQSIIEVSRSAIIAPIVSELSSVRREVEFLMKLGNVEELEPRLNTVLSLLKNGGFQLIHFACHGSFDPEEHEQSIIYLQGDDKLKSRDISGEKKNFGKDKPLVVINACQTSRADFSLVGIGSWAHKFINSKSGGFLGASWEVNDRLAYRFCKSFYSALLTGKTIGEAMREARFEIRGKPDPTWLAYTLYADPLAKVIFV